MQDILMSGGCKTKGQVVVKFVNKHIFPIPEIKGKKKGSTIFDIAEKISYHLLSVFA